MESKELEEMRSQITLLRSKLEKQQIINDSIVSNAIRRNVGGIGRIMNISLGAGIFAIVYCPFAFAHLCNLSVYFVAFTELMLVWSLWKTLHEKRVMPSAIDCGADVVGFVDRLDRFDRMRKRSLAGGMAMITVFFVWLLVELSMKFDAEMFYGMTISVSVGLAVGLAIALKMFFGISHRLDDLRRDAQALRQE